MGVFEKTFKFDRSFLKKLFNKDLIFRKLKERLRNLKRKERISKASPEIKQIFEKGYLKLSWMQVFGENIAQSNLYKEMKEECNKLNFDDSCKYKSDKTFYLAKKYTKGSSIVDGALLRFIHSTNIDKILSQYFLGNYRLIYADYWLSKFHNKQRVGSQLWHCDPEDPVMLKIFVYFQDVTEKNGATEIIQQTQVEGSKCFRAWHKKKLSGGYIENKELKMKFPDYKKYIFKAEGEEGDIFLIDTTALHRGGYGINERRIANISFVSMDCQIPPEWRSSYC